MPVESKPRLILDTNILISGSFYKGSLLREVVSTGFKHYELIFSTQTWDELADVFQRDFLEKITPLAQRLRLLAEIASQITVIESHTLVTDCKDQKDNKFLSLALDGDVKTIVTGDDELLKLHPWRGVDVLTVHGFFEKHTG